VPKSAEVFWLGNQRILPATYRLTLYKQPLPENFQFSWQGKVLKPLSKPIVKEGGRWIYLVVRECFKEA